MWDYCNYQNGMLDFNRFSGPVGKSELSKKINERFGYNRVELDAIIDQIIVEEHGDRSFFKLYMEKFDNQEIKTKSINKVRSIIQSSVDVGIVIEGAIIDNNLIDKIFDGIQYDFVLILPKNKKVYKNAILERYKKDIEHGTQTLGYVWRTFPENARDIHSKPFREHLDKISGYEYKRALGFRDIYEKYPLFIVENDYEEPG